MAELKICLCSGKARLKLKVEVKMITNNIQNSLKTLKACPNGKCLTVKHAKKLFVGKTFFRLATLFCAV